MKELVKGLNPEERRAAIAKLGLSREDSKTYTGCRRVVVVGPSPDAPLIAPGVNDTDADAVGAIKIRSGTSAAAGACVPVLRYKE